MTLHRCPNRATWKIFYADEDPETYGLICDACILRIATDEGRTLRATEPFDGDAPCGQFAAIVLSESAPTAAQARGG